MLQIKEELVDTKVDIGPTTLQRMDSHYTTDQPDMTVVKQESTTDDNNVDATLCSGVKQQEFVDIELTVSVTPPEQRVQSDSYRCDKCVQTFTSKDILRHHYRLAHLIEPYEYNVCNQELKQEPSKSTSHDGKLQFECAICQKIYKSRDALHSHVTNYHRPSPTEFGLEVIAKYKEHPCLWQVTHEDYHNKDKKNAALEELAILFHTQDPAANKETVLKKINSLRSCFKKENNKNFDDRFQSPHSQLGSTSNPSQNSSRLSFRKRKANTDTVCSKMSTSLDTLNGPKKRRKQKHDAFGEYVAEQLREMPPDMQIYCKKIINDSIFQAEMESLNYMSRIVTDPVSSSIAENFPIQGQDNVNSKDTKIKNSFMNA